MTADEWDRTDRFRAMLRVVTDPPGKRPPPPPRVGLLRRLFARPADPPAVPPRLTDRPVRFVVAGCCRSGVYGDDNPAAGPEALTMRAAAGLIERYGGDALTDADRAVLDRLDALRVRVYTPTPAERAVSLATESVDVFGLLAHVVGDFMTDLRQRYVPEESAPAADILRCVVGNPLRPAVAFDPTWRSSTVRALAASMHTANDFGPMPVLADALQDAGCGDERILNHARTGPHVRGCWVVEAIRGMP